MSLDFHKEHSVEILLNLFGGLPPTLRGWKPQAHEAVTDLLVDPQPFVSVTAHLTHFISLNCFLIFWGQQHCRSVFRALCVLKFQILSFYFIIHLSWKGRFHLEGQECRFRVKAPKRIPCVAVYQPCDLGEYTYRFWAWAYSINKGLNFIFKYPSCSKVLYLKKLSLWMLTLVKIHIVIFFIQWKDHSANYRNLVHSCITILNKIMFGH